MKTNIKLLFTAALIGLTTSCTDLDVTPSSQYTYDASAESGIDPMIMVEAKMSDIYFHLAGTFGRRYMEAQCLASDEFTCLAFDGGYYDSGTYAHQALHCSVATDASLDWYSDLTAGITKANTILEEFSSGSAQMRAPARAMRAYFTWILMDSFGDTTILEKVPAALAAKVTKMVSCPTIGIGAGNGTDGQVLVSADAMGMTVGFKPKFLRYFAQIGEAITDGVGDYVRAVKDSSFPNESESY
jgi:hypothetical protein